MLLERKRRHRVHQEGSWAVSYVDMLTLLLCFFIIFFNSKSITQEDESSVLKKVLKSMTQPQTGTSGGFEELNRAKCENGGTLEGDGTCGVPTGGTGSAPGAQMGTLTGQGAGASTGDGVGSGGDQATGQSTERDLIEQIKLTFDSMANTETVVKNKALMIDFHNISFFKSGSTQISLQGQKNIDRMIQNLAPYRGQVRITVQGHTDSMLVKGKRAPFTDNWELSVLRSTAVLKSFLKAGYPQELLTAEGFADTQAISQSPELARKITLKIEPKEKP